MPREARGSGEDQRRKRERERKRDEGDIECHPEIAEVNFDGRPAQRGGFARRALSRALEASRKPRMKDEVREASPREKDGPKRYRELSVVFKGMERQDGRCG